MVEMGTFFPQESTRFHEPNFSGLIVRGENTEAYLRKHGPGNPRLIKDFENIAFRFEGYEMGVHDRAVGLFPGLGRRIADQTRSRNEFREVWIPQLSLPRSFAQIHYPAHTFVHELMTRQWEDLIVAYNNPELDLIGVSFGAFHILPLIADISRRRLPIRIKSATLIIPGINKDDSTPGARLASRLIEIASKTSRVFLPTWLMPNFAGLGIRGAAFPDLLTAQDLPKDLRVKAFIAAQDEIFDPHRTKASLLSLCPKANIELIPGGHRWTRERIQLVSQATAQFLNES